MKRLPRHNLKLGDKMSDGYEFGAYRDKVGNVSFLFWKMGVGFKKDQEIRIHCTETKKLKAWLEKIIEYQERK